MSVYNGESETYLETMIYQIEHHLHVRNKFAINVSNALCHDVKIFSST